MKFRGMEDRLNPIPPEGVDETTLGGYAAVHGRAPAFEGPDGFAYTVAVETDESDVHAGSWVGFLVFVRWAAEGSAIMGHLETDDLVEAASAAEARLALEEWPLTRVKALLDETIDRKRQWEAGA